MNQLCTLENHKSHAKIIEIGQLQELERNITCVANMAISACLE